LRFKVLNWDTDVIPGVGVDAQSVISSQIGDEYDVYVGLLGAHFGSPTARAGSGTEEEFDLAYSRYERDPACVRILFYFKSGTDDIFALDLDQLGKVRRFKDKLKDGGVLFHDFSDDDALAKAVSNHFQQLIQRQWTGKDWSVLSPRSVPGLDKTSAATEKSPTAVTGAEDVRQEEESEQGVLDLIVTGTEAMESLFDTLRRIGMFQTDLGAEITRI
jgi:hypothetical protein